MWADAWFYVNDSEIKSDQHTDLGVMISNMDGFNVDDYTDGNADLNFEEGKFSESEIEQITEKWNIEGDEVLNDLGFSETSSEWYITSEIQCHEAEDDEEDDDYQSLSSTKRILNQRPPFSFTTTSLIPNQFTKSMNWSREMSAPFT